MTEMQSSKSPFRASFITMSSPSNLEHRIADRWWKACSGLTTVQSTPAPAGSLSGPHHQATCLKVQRGEEGQLFVVRSRGVGSVWAALYEQRCAHRRGRASSVPGEYLCSLRNHSLREAYSGVRHCVEKDPGGWITSRMTKGPDCVGERYQPDCVVGWAAWQLLCVCASSVTDCAQWQLFRTSPHVREHQRFSLVPKTTAWWKQDRQYQSHFSGEKAAF